MLHVTSTVVADEDVIDAVISASRALVAVAARSLAGVEVTLAQYRALVVLASRGAQRASDLAAALDANPSTATRMCDRLAAKSLIVRDHPAGDRRALDIAITPEGAGLVRAVTIRRRSEIARTVAAMPVSGRPALIRALRAFADAAGEVPEQDWSLGWGE